MSCKKPYLPGVLSLIAEEISEEVAIKLAKAKGGRPVYIPDAPKAQHGLSKIVGLDNAILISTLLGRGEVVIPYGGMGGEAGHRAGRWERIKALRKQGLSGAEIAAEVDVHIRTVERVIASLADDRQSELPF